MILAGIVLCVLAVHAGAQEKNTDNKIKPCAIISGNDSHVTTKKYLRITSMKDWVCIWQEHHGEKPQESYDFYYDPLTLPIIDFNNYMVIVTFQGNTWNCTGLKLFSITEESQQIVFRYDEKNYQTFGRVDSGEIDNKASVCTDSASELDGKVVAYGFFVLPRTKKPIIIEENIQYRLGEPPIWEKRAVLSENQEY